MIGAALGAILAGSPWAALAGLGLLLAGVGLLVWHLRRQRRAATWEVVEPTVRRHPSYRSRHRQATRIPQPRPAASTTSARRCDTTVLIPRLADRTEMILRQRDGRR